MKCNNYNILGGNIHKSIFNLMSTQFWLTAIYGYVYKCPLLIERT